jgi:hypothetical protein
MLAESLYPLVTVILQEHQVLTVILVVYPIMIFCL